MKNDNKESKRDRTLHAPDKRSENEINPNNNDENMKQQTDNRKRSQTEHENARDVLSRGYYPDGPGGKFRGA